MSCYILLYHSILHWIIYMYIILSHTIWDHIHSYPIIFSYYHIILACYPIISYHIILYSQYQIISTTYHFPFISVSSSKHPELHHGRSSDRGGRALRARATVSLSSSDSSSMPRMAMMSWSPRWPRWPRWPEVGGWTLLQEMDSGQWSMIMWWLL